VWFVLPDRPQQARWLTKEEKAIIQARLDSDAAAMGQHQNHRLMDAFTSGRVWLLCLLYFLMNVGGYGYELWMPSIIKSFSGKSDLMVGLINAIPYTFAGVVMFLVGRHSDRMGERRWHVAGAAFASAIGFALSAYFQNQYLALAALALAFAGIKSTLGPFWALATGFLSGTAAAGGIALINSVGNLGGYFGPDIVGRIKVYIHDPAAGNVVALLFLGAALFGMGVMTLTIRTKSKPAGLARDS
jgi:ACS family tartrate transporter-like MFS transporter